jgi:hypothetical protein
MAPARCQPALRPVRADSNHAIPRHEILAASTGSTHRVDRQPAGRSLELVARGRYSIRRESVIACFFRPSYVFRYCLIVKKGYSMGDCALTTGGLLNV